MNRCRTNCKLLRLVVTLTLAVLATTPVVFLHDPLCLSQTDMIGHSRGSLFSFHLDLPENIN